MASFAEEVALTIWERSNGGWRCTCGPMAVAEEGDAADYRACVMGLRDYVRKNRFPSVLLGLSGGIDSALAATVAADALGPEQVHAVMLPYRYTSAESLADAEACAKALGIRYDVVPIGDAVEAELRALQPIFAGRAPDTTEENIQSRTRGTLLMSISNKLGGMLVTTGNKSEMSVGYATLYGDMNGGYNPLKDLYKTEVYRLARLRNGWRPHDALGPAGAVIPESIIEKAPSAELREGQRDQDSLPPYEVLDAILERLVERDMGVRDIVAEGYDEATVRRVEHLLYAAEFKRRQAPPGVKVTARNFGRDRRYPITNAFRDAR
jgi:NAD+ synthase